MPVAETFFDNFYQQVKKNPKKTAVSFYGRSLDYQGLDEQSNQFANYLLSLGVPKNAVIGIYLERSLEMLIAMLGIMKAGAAYVPLDPIYPKDRLEFMLADTEAKLLITSSALNNTLNNNIPCVLVDELGDALSVHAVSRPTTELHAEDLAYIIFTSGSTGKPKGAQILHRGLQNFLSGISNQLVTTDKDTFLGLSTISFDISILELLLPLTIGAKIVLVDSETRLDGLRILETLRTENITVFQATPVTWRMVLDAGWVEKLPLTALCGGEAFPIDLANTLVDRCREVWNLYGPTETTVWAMARKVVKTETAIPIGHPIEHVNAYVLNEQLKQVPPGEIGEIYIGGAGVGPGYVNRPELNEEVFIDDPFSSAYGGRMYKTGDLGKILENGEILCLGRIDHQVKIRGFRVELGEIENTIGKFPGVKKTCVHYWDQKYAGRRLVGYVIGEDEVDINNAELAAFLRKTLPDYMVPTSFVQLKSFPLTQSGKIDRKALPIPVAKRPEMDVLYKVPKSPIERHIADIWASLLEIDRVGADDNFFDLGGNSMLASKTISLLKEQYAIALPIASLYRHATVARIAESLSDSGVQPSLSCGAPAKKHQTENSEIAIIGMAGRFPGADNIVKLWNILTEGKEAISFFQDEELDKQIPDADRISPDYVKARGIIDKTEWFDPELFGLTPVVASLMDPQHRIFLEICREVLESSGHLPRHYHGRVGIYAGCDSNTYYTNNLLSNPDEVSKIGAYQVTLLNEKDYLTSRVAYHLNLKGPAVSVYSACSTSLLAVAEAVTAIRNGHCDAAIAGGISIHTPIKSGHMYQEGAMLTNDGHCRPFDAKGKGTMFSDGGGVVLLKDLAAARRDGDHIFGVIKGIGVNNDGFGKGSFTAPSAEGQAGAISMALHDAQVEASTIGYIEAHGTATPIGDPIEIEGLKLAFGTQEARQFCRIGSIKGNIGHLVHAAGIAGLIKATLALHHKIIPPSINYDTPNPNIDFENSPFLVNDTLTEWKSESVRRAGVSSFGVGGTNVHVILEEYEGDVAEAATSPKTDTVTINWSARSESSLMLYAEKLTDYIEQHPNAALHDLAHTLQASRQDYPVRATTTASSIEELRLQLTDKTWKTNTLVDHIPHLVFMFPGQGAQYIGMGKTLYERERVYREAIDKCATILLEKIGEDIRKVLFDTDHPKAKERLQNTQYTQPALFITEYALSQLWESWGIVPEAFVGHSVGEFVAAHLAGVFSLEDALTLVAARGKLISGLPAGSMLSVRTSISSIADILPSDISVAAVNAPNLCVLSGMTATINKFAEILENQGIKTSFLHTSHAFHSEMMTPILDAFKTIVSSVSLAVPRKPIASTVTGDWLKDSEATSPDYWVDHVKSTVRFSDAIQLVHKELNPVLLEVGPGNVTSTLSKQHPGVKVSMTIGGMITQGDGLDEFRSLSDALGKLWLNGFAPDWSATTGNQPAKILPFLPTYAYNRKYCWVEPATSIRHESKQIASYLNKPSVLEVSTAAPQAMGDSRTAVEQKIVALLENSTGGELDLSDPGSTFIELGLDSLLLTQIATNAQKTFGIPITFRMLNEDYSTLDKLVKYVASNAKEIALPVAQESSDEAVGGDATAHLAFQVQSMAKQLNQLQASIDRLLATPASLSPDRQDQGYQATQYMQTKSTFEIPPLPGARLGKNKLGKPAWFMESDEIPGKFVEISTV